MNRPTISTCVRKPFCRNRCWNTTERMLSFRMTALFSIRLSTRFSRSTRRESAHFSATFPIIWKRKNLSVRTKPVPVAGKSNLSDKERKRMEADLRRERYNLLKPYKDQFEKVEKEIAKLEARKKEIEELMLDPEFYKHDEEAKKTAHEYTDLKKNLETAYYQWNVLTEKMAEVEKGIADGR